MATLMRGRDGSGGFRRCRRSLCRTVVLDSSRLSMNRSEVEVLKAIVFFCRVFWLWIANGMVLLIMLVLRLCSVVSTGVKGCLFVCVLLANCMLLDTAVVIGGRKCTMALVSL